jgi:hypothetical protein
MNINSDNEDQDLALAQSIDEHLSAEHVDRLKLVAVVDSARTFSNNDVSIENNVNLIPFSASSWTKNTAESLISQ